MSDHDHRRIFIVASEDSKIVAHLEATIKVQIPNATVFTACDGLEAEFKCENVPPHVVILDDRLPKLSAMELTEKLIRRKDRVAVILFSPVEIQEQFMDCVATGQVQFLSGHELQDVFTNHLRRSLHWVALGEQTGYQMRLLSAGEYLLKTGEPACYVYLLKNGKLTASKQHGGQVVTLGTVLPGEFVGEMAYINGEPRSADVRALTDCELIEIPSEHLDAVLYSKPAWSKALMRTLSRRLKVSNDTKT